jgi:hypothetical protein
LWEASEELTHFGQEHAELSVLYIEEMEANHAAEQEWRKLEAEKRKKTRTQA